MKICGITNAEDARAAVEAGADAIGINLFPGSKRFVDLGSALEWAADVSVSRVAVVVNADAGLVRRIERSGCFDAIQFHGDEPPEFCAASPLPWIRAVRVSGPEALAEALSYSTPALLLDAAAAAGFGGTGIALDWGLAEAFVAGQPERRVALAGGLRPDSVAAAVRRVRPAAVDVASGVERAGDPRRKDAAKVRAFVEAAKSALD